MAKAKYEKPERVNVQLIVTMHFKKMVQKLNLGTRDAQKLKIRHTRLLTKADIRGISKGKTPPIRPIRCELSFTTPVHVVAKRRRAYQRLRKRSGLDQKES